MPRNKKLSVFFFLYLSSTISGFSYEITKNMEMKAICTKKPMSMKNEKKTYKVEVSKWFLNG